MLKKVLNGREKVKVAAVQAASVFMDKEKTIEKACQLIKEAGANGAELIAFPEAFIPAFPNYYSCGNHNQQTEWFPYNLALQENSVLIPSEDTEILGQAARQAGAYVVMGCNELDDRLGSLTMYNTLLFLGKDGQVLGRHRKLMPTYGERIYWGKGDASDLRVFDTDIGRIGGLICYENHMILLRAAMIHLGEEFHICNWPGSWSFAGPRCAEAETEPLGSVCDVQPAIREHSFEAQAFTISCSAILRDEDLPEQWQHLTQSPNMNYSFAIGGSAIVSPSGGYLAGPVFNEETILYADCDANMIRASKLWFDSLGHYTRWDVVRLDVRKEPWGPDAPVRDRLLKLGDLPSSELRRLSEQFEISIEKLEELTKELASVKSS